MCQFATVLLAILLAGALEAQSDWRRIGNSAIDLSLPGVASGPVARVWYSADGASLYALLDQGRVWETQDFEHWKPSSQSVPTQPAERAVETRPEASARVEQAVGRAGRWYAAGRFVYRSDDNGAGWTNLTAYRNQSILGEGLTGLAPSPRDPEEITVSSATGIWRSMDGGATWSGLNEGLPNLPARKIIVLPNGYRPARLLGQGDLELEWLPGEKTGWRPAHNALQAPEQYLRSQIGARWSTTITAAVNLNA